MAGGRLFAIGLLGAFRLTYHGIATVVRSPRLQSLFAALALRRDLPLPRSEVAGLLWPDSDESQARTNLRKLIVHVRQTVTDADRLLDLDSPCLGWRPDVALRLDTAEFEAAVQEGSRGALERALEIYRGDLLPGWEDDWVARERERLRELYTSSLQRLAELREGARDYRGAAEPLRRLLRDDPLREDIHRQLMRLYALGGEPDAVAHAYRECSDVLRRDLGTEPGPATRRLFEQLTAEEDDPAGSTLGAELAAREAKQFVGREEQLLVFRPWLSSTAPELLNVHGPGGSGKSALLRMYAGMARRLGRTVVLLDARECPQARDGFAAALSPGVPEGAVERLNAARPLLLIDTFEELGERHRWLLEDILPQLDARVRIVIAGRVPVARVWGPDCPWSRLVRPLALTGLSPEEAREYLRRRGVTDDTLAERVRSAAGGNPLALSLAADLVTQLGARDLRTAPEWRLALRSLVEQLLREVGDGRLRDVLDACAVVRRFDQRNLVEMTGRKDVAAAFEQLCRLSVVHPAERGLAIHDDVRRILAEDLRWRDPRRYNDLRLRAVHGYRRRMKAAPPLEQEQLAEECLFLLGHALTQALLFPGSETDGIWTEPVRPADHTEIRRIWTAWLKSRLALSPPLTGDRGLTAVLAYPDARLRIARDREGRAVGFSGIVPVCREALPLLTGDSALSGLARSRWTESERASWPPGAAQSTVFVLRFLAETGPRPDTVRAALLRDMVGILARGGTYYVATPIPEYKALVEALGFVPLQDCRDWSNGSDHPSDVYELDLSQIGFMAWIEGLIRGRPASGATGKRQREPAR